MGQDSPCARALPSGCWVQDFGLSQIQALSRQKSRRSGPACRPPYNPHGDKAVLSLMTACKGERGTVTWLPTYGPARPGGTQQQAAGKEQGGGLETGFWYTKWLFPSCCVVARVDFREAGVCYGEESGPKASLGSIWEASAERM